MPKFSSVSRNFAWLALVLSVTVLLALVATTSFNREQKAEAATGATLTVNASQPVYPFSDGIRGVATNSSNWIWHGLWDRGSANSCCAPGKTEAILDATSYIEPGVIRFGGARWVNRTGWSRDGSAPEDGYWTYTDPQTSQVYEYTHAYSPGMVDAFAEFSSELDAEGIIQINVCDNNPRMWQDLLIYTNIENSYDFKYWELGNEQSLDEESCGLESDTYAERFITYQNALKAIDPSIKMIGPITHQPYFPDWEDELVDELGTDLDVLGFHWYQLVTWSFNQSSFAYQGGSLESLMAHDGSVGSACHDGFGCASSGTGIADYRWNRWVYRRGVAEQKMEYINSNYRPSNPTLETAITEFGIYATDHEHPINSNHAAAVWMADVLPRWAYNGLDMIAFYSLEDGATWGGNSRGLIGVNSYDVLDVRPTYYTEFMYAQYFGDMMVQTSTSDQEEKVVVWASTDSEDPGKLKLMLVNLSEDTSSTQVRLNGFTADSAVAYEMRSGNPTSMANPNSFTNHSTTINGVQIPDYDIDNPAGFRNAIASIQPDSISVSSDRFSYTIEPFSVVAVTLDGTFGSGPTPTPTPTPTPEPPNGNPAQLVVSSSADRSGSVALNGQTVEDDIFVWISPDNGITSAAFYVDDPSRSGSPWQTEGVAPFDLEGTSWTGLAGAFDTDDLSDGTHTVTAVINFSGGSTAVRTATFTVNNSGAPTPTPSPTPSPSPTPTATPPAPTPTPTVSPSATPPPNSGEVNALFSYSANRSSASDLDGALVSGEIYVWTAPDDGVDSVSFYIDDPSASGAALRTENFEPFDLSGTNGNGNSNAFNTASLNDGVHTLTIKVTLFNGSQFTSTSTFTVINGSSDVDVRAGNNANRSSSFALHTSTVSGDIYVWVPVQSGLSSVSFFIDDSDLSSSPYRTENVAPFDLGGTHWSGSSLPFSTTSLSNGIHVLSVRLTMSNGDEIVGHTTFIVNN